MAIAAVTKHTTSSSNTVAEIPETSIIPFLVSIKESSVPICVDKIVLTGKNASNIYHYEVLYNG